MFISSNIHTNFLPTHSTDYWEECEFSHFKCEIVYLFSIVSLYPHVFWIFIYYIYIYILRIFKSLLENWTVFHFAMFFFISVNIPCFEIYFIWYLNKLYFFGLVLASYTFIHPFTFNQCLSVYLKWVSYR